MSVKDETESARTSLRWTCCTRTQVLHAASEAHEAAVSEGFDVNEATTLSLTLAELTSVADAETEASVSISAGGWRLEVTARTGVVPRAVLAQAHSAFHSEHRSDGSVVFIADYRRPRMAHRRSSLRAAMLDSTHL